MSLDVYLTLSDMIPRPPKERIFIREDGQTKEIARDEWDSRFPGQAPIAFTDDGESDMVYSANITHNLHEMAVEAGLSCVWRPEDEGINRAEQLIAPFKKGLTLLRQEPERFKKFNPKNGWGNYDVLIQFVSDYLDACERYPSAEISVSR